MRAYPRGQAASSGLQGSYLSLSLVVLKSCSSNTVSKLFLSIWTSTTILSSPGPLIVTCPFLPAYFLAAADPPSLRTRTRSPTSVWLLTAQPPLDQLLEVYNLAEPRAYV